MPAPEYFRFFVVPDTATLKGDFSHDIRHVPVQKYICIDPPCQKASETETIVADLLFRSKKIKKKTHLHCAQSGLDFVEIDYNCKPVLPQPINHLQDINQDPFALLHLTNRKSPYAVDVDVILGQQRSIGTR